METTEKENVLKGVVAIRGLDVVRDQLLRSRVIVAMILTALMASSVIAQQVARVETGLSPKCVWDNTGTVSRRPDVERSNAPAGKAKFEFFQGQSGEEPNRCDYYALARPRSSSKNSDLGKSFLNNKTSSSTSAGPAETQADAPAANEAQELAKKLSNPVASLISFPLQSNFDFGMGAGSGWRYTLNIQPVIPIKLNENWNLISRTIIPIIHQGNVTGPNTSQSGLGDTVQSFFFSPNKSEPFIWAVGPVALIPTATNAALGGQKWGLGPTALALKQKNGWTYGVLANHIWSVAGKSNRADISATFVQPFLSYSTKDAWTYSLNTESTYDWKSDKWSIPINPFISKLVRFGKQPVSFGGGLKCWATTPSGGPGGCGLRVVVTALFPKK